MQKTMVGPPQEFPEMLVAIDLQQQLDSVNSKGSSWIHMAKLWSI